MATALLMLSQKPVGYRCCFRATISRKPTSPACRREHPRKLDRSDQTSRGRSTSDRLSQTLYERTDERAKCKRTASHPLEIGALGDRQALQIAAQAVEAQLDGAEAHPVASAIDARAAG